MNLSHAELKRRLASNPDLAAANETMPVGVPGTPRTHETTDGRIVTLTAAQDGAQTLYDHIRILAPDLHPLFVREYPFDRWRIDLAVPSSLLAVEVNGGRWLPGGGKHGTERDRKKIRRLTVSGWRVLEYSTEMLANDPLGIIAEIREALCKS